MGEIILNESLWVEERLSTHTLGTNPVDTIGRVASYYYFSGYKKSEIGRMVEEFILRCDENADITKWLPVIESRVKNADKYKLIDIDFIPITQNELDSVGSADGIVRQRLLFTLICLAKYGNAVSQKNSNWVNRESREIFDRANIHLSSTRNALLINDLWSAGYIGYSSIVDNLNLNVKCVDQDGDAVLQIVDFRNLGNQYMLHMGHNYIPCKCCGAVVKKTNNRTMYCPRCAVEIHSRQIIDGRKQKVA